MKIDEKIGGFISAVIVIIGIINVINLPSNTIRWSDITLSQIIGLITVLSNILIGVYLILLNEK